MLYNHDSNYLTNTNYNFKILIEGCGDLRKPHPSPELEAVLSLRHFHSNAILRRIKYDEQRETEKNFKKFIG